MQLDSSKCPAGQVVHLSPNTDADRLSKHQVTGLPGMRDDCNCACTRAALHDDMPGALICHLSWACIQVISQEVAMLQSPWRQARTASARSLQGVMAFMHL